MVALKYQLESGAEGHEALREGLLKVRERLHEWRDRLVSDRWSSEWVVPECKAKRGDNLLVDPPEVCYLFNEWRLLQLGVSHLLRELELRTNDAANKSGFSWEIGWIDNIIASKDSMLGRGPTNPACQWGHTDEGRADFPTSTTATQACYSMPLGPRLFGQCLDRLEALLSKALRNLVLPAEVASHYRQAANWVRRERSAFRTTLPSFPP